jgi:hypothetical protein
MKELNYTYWQSGKWFIGFLNDYPEHQTEGKSINELEKMLLSLYEDIKNYNLDNPSPKLDGKILISK